MTSATRPHALLTLLVVSLAVAVSEGARLKSFTKTHPHLRCSACDIMTIAAGIRINNSLFLNKHDSVLSTHRLDKRNKKERTKYSQSELFVVEILDNLCANIEQNVSLAFNEDDIRVFTFNKALKKAHLYSEDESKVLYNPKSRLRDVCEEHLERHEEIWSREIRRQTDLHKLTDAVCTKGTKECEPAALARAVREEEHRREYWQSKGLRPIKAGDH